MNVKEQEGSQITPDLDGMMTEGRVVFDGNMPPDVEAVAAPVVRPGQSGPGGEKEEKAGEGEKPAEEEPAGGKKPAAEKKAEGAGKEPDPNKKKEDKPPDAEHRFPNHDEAEKGYRNLQGEKTKAELRAKTAEEELERIKNETRLKEEAAQKKADMVKSAAARRKKALEDIDALDPEAADYRDKAADILAEADLDIMENFRTETPGQKPPVKTEQRLPVAEEKPAAGEDAKADSLVAQIETKITAEGLDKEDELFWMFADRAPAKDEKGQPLDLEGQVAWAVTKTKEYHNKFQKAAKTHTEEEAAALSRRHQEQELPLGSGARAVAGGPGGKKDGDEDKPVSLADAVDAAMEQRRI